jgi:hypothetical protein
MLCAVASPGAGSRRSIISSPPAMSCAACTRSGPAPPPIGRVAFSAPAEGGEQLAGRLGVSNANRGNAYRGRGEPGREGSNDTPPSFRTCAFRGGVPSAPLMSPSVPVIHGAFRIIANPESDACHWRGSGKIFRL